MLIELTSGAHVTRSGDAARARACQVRVARGQYQRGSQELTDPMDNRKIRNMKKPMCLLAAVVATIGCSGNEKTAEPRVATPDQLSRTDESTQRDLVAGMPTSHTKSRVRRTFQTGPALTQPAPRLPYDAETLASAATTRAAVDAEVEANLARSDWPVETPAGKIRLINTDLEAGVETEVELDLSEIDSIRKEGEARGLNRAFGPSEIPRLAETPDLSAQGWSYGWDARIAKRIPTYGVFDRVLSRMGRLDYGCTATMVGRRLLLTAAHCVVQPNGAQTAHTYWAREDGTTQPFGAAHTAGYWWDGAYLAAGCASGSYVSGSICTAHDWALMILPTNAFAGSPNGTPGWMGYWIPGTQIQSNVLSNDGYPLCGLPESPYSCIDNVAYGDQWQYKCNATSFQFPDANDGNFNRFYKTGCDMGRGHSGSATWTDYPGANGPYDVGVVITQDCYGTDCAGNAHPAGVRSMTPFLAGFISTQRANYP